MVACKSHDSNIKIKNKSINKLYLQKYVIDYTIWKNLNCDTNSKARGEVKV